MDAAKAAIRDLEAMETRQGAVRQTVCPGSEQEPGGQNGRDCSRTMAHSQQPRTEHRVPHRLLRQAWSSKAVHWSLAQPLHTAGCGPAYPVVWQGRRGDSPPYADTFSLTGEETAEKPASSIAGRRSRWTTDTKPSQLSCERAFSAAVVKALVDSLAFAARLKSCPFKAMSFSAAG